MLRAGIEYLEKDDIVRVAKKLRGYAGTTRKEGLPYVRLNQQQFYRNIICANVIQVHKEIKGSTNCIDHYCLAYLVRFVNSLPVQKTLTSALWDLFLVSLFTYYIKHESFFSLNLFAARARHAITVIGTV